MNGNRIEYIDALRGFTMILVVWGHVEMFSFYKFSHISFIVAMVYSFHMPLFFFVSGILSSKYLDTINSIQILYDQVVRKCKTLFFPVLIWGLLYAYVNELTYYDFIFSPEKLGYWFTICLFEIFIFYFISIWILKKINIGIESKTILIFFSSIAFFLISFKVKSSEDLYLMKELLSLHCTFTYYQYFIFGVLAFKYKRYFEKLLDNTSFTATIFSLFIVGFIVWRNLNNLSSTEITWSIRFRDIMLFPFLGFCGIMIVFNYFRLYEVYFKINKTLGKVLQYIGKHTLDIYVLHYFFLPSIPLVGTFLTSNIVIEIFLSLVLSLMIIVVCLICSHIIRSNDIISVVLFGRKNE